MKLRHRLNVSTLPFMPGILKRAPSRYSQNPRPQKQAKPAGPAFDAIPTETNPLWANDEEHSAPGNKPRSGPAPDLLARALTKPCHPAGDPSLRRDNAYYRCIASSVCAWTLKAWDRNLPRIYKHVGRCRALRNWQPVLFRRAESVLASMAPGGFEEPDSSLQGQANPEGPANSRELLLTNPFSRYNNLGSMSFQDQLDHALAALICASGSPARLIEGYKLGLKCVFT
ncbi:unnamed protein product [Rhizoctonia solani]|uniref:Uncharacterized protein n=1 Tax=Rhizoctonia solani TaxID=456999 RepID=A0A8H3BWQ3_9AGAM|nr:unnamed protein product [Rhizoctonia solani]